MRRLVLSLLVAGSLLAGSAGSAAAFIHVTIPADECATMAAVTPGNATDAPVTKGGQTPPLGGLKNAPTDCPAPNK